MTVQPVIAPLHLGDTRHDYLFEVQGISSASHKMSRNRSLLDDVQLEESKTPSHVRQMRAICYVAGP